MKAVSLGLGLDTPFGSSRGFEDAAMGSTLQRFLARNGEEFEAFFFSFQQRSYGPLRANDYIEAFSRLHEEASKFAGLVNLHHTMLNLGSTLPYDRGAIIDVTNEITETLPFGWINEDVGIWFLEGKSVPYPLPPILTRESLEICVRTVRNARRALSTPLSIEIPGVTDGAAFSIGDLDLFDYFAELADRSQSLVTLDTGHLLGWEWGRGRFESEMYRHLERFPFEQVVEIHMAGSEVRGGSFIDRHHGVLLDEQFSLLDFLMERCPNLRVVTYEDPKFDAKGDLISVSRPSFEALKERSRKWKKNESSQTSCSA